MITVDGKWKDESFLGMFFSCSFHTSISPQPNDARITATNPTSPSLFPPLLRLVDITNLNLFDRVVTSSNHFWYQQQIFEMNIYCYCMLLYHTSHIVMILFYLVIRCCHYPFKMTPVPGVPRRRQASCGVKCRQRGRDVLASVKLWLA